MATFAAFLAAVVLAGAGQATVPSQTSQDLGQATDLGEVTVSGQRAATSERAATFVRKVAAPALGADSLARWRGSVCVGTANLKADSAQIVIDQVSSVALSLGLQIGEPGCKANVMIVASDRASAPARRLVSEAPQNFRPAQGRTDLGRAALRAFERSEAPVRWWTVSLPVNVDTGNVAVRLNGDMDPPYQTVRGTSLLVSGTRSDLSHVVIIVDSTRTIGVPLDVLSDYLAMVALAQIDPSADMTGQASILNLFGSGGERPTRLTEWDMAYLRGLYSARDDRAVATHQTREIARTMVSVVQQETAPAIADGREQ